MRLLPVFELGERVLVAVSGGADSVALLCRLAEDAPIWRLSLIAAHVHHGIRGEADADRDFVRDLCARLQVPLCERAVDAPAEARDRHIGLETAARDLRWAALRAMRDEAGADVIAVAHHADDQAETVLMHLLRGGGIHGAAAMRPRADGVARPLLHTTRAEIRDYLAAIGQPFREDATNAVPDNPRNALRLTAMPALSAIYPAAARSLCRFADIAAAEDDLLSNRADRWLRANAARMPFGWRVACVPTERAVLRRALRRLIADADYADVEALRALYLKGGGAIECCGYRAERVGDAAVSEIEDASEGIPAQSARALVSEIGDASGDFPAQSARALVSEVGDRSAQSAPRLYLIRDGCAPTTDVLPIPADIPASGARLTLPGFGALTLTPCAPAPIRGDPYRQAVDVRALRGACLRVRRMGDVMRPLGAPGGKSLSDIMIDLKIDRPIRDYLPLLARGNRILWIPGARLSQDAALQSDTTDAMTLTWRGEDESYE